MKPSEEDLKHGHSRASLLSGLLETRYGNNYYNNVFSRSEVITPETEDLTSLEVVAMNTPQGLIYPEQKSYFCSLAWCERGGFTVNGRGWSLEVSAGEVAVLGTSIHYSATAGEDGAEGYYLLMDGPQCHQLIEKANLWQGAFRYREIPKEWLNFIASGLTNKGQQAMASHIGYQVFMQVGQQAEEAFPHPLLWKACNYIQRNWSDANLNVESILAHVEVSRSKLSTLFKEYMGISILRYVNGVRLDNAKRLLTGGLDPISEIAHACGLHDTSHFSSWFRKQTGVTPSRFRRDAP